MKKRHKRDAVVVGTAVAVGWLSVPIITPIVLAASGLYGMGRLAMYGLKRSKAKRKGYKNVREYEKACYKDE